MKKLIAFLLTVSLLLGVCSLALAAGYIPIHLGPSRLRTETAAVTAVEAVYLSRC